MPKTSRGRLMPSLLIIVTIAALGSCADRNSGAAGSYEDLLTLFEDWRAFEQPPLLNGAPDYTAGRFARAYAELPKYQARLNAIDPGGWPIEQQVDWHLVRAEMKHLVGACHDGSPIPARGRADC